MKETSKKDRRDSVEKMKTLRDDGIDKIRNGVTTIEELMRETASF